MHNLQTGGPDSPVGSGEESQSEADYVWSVCPLYLHSLVERRPVMCDSVPPMSEYTGASDAITQSHSHSFATSDTASHSLVRDNDLL